MVNSVDYESKTVLSVKLWCSRHRLSQGGIRGTSPPLFESVQFHKKYLKDNMSKNYGNLKRSTKV